MPCSIVFHPSINEWNGRREVQLELKDLVVDSEAPAPVTACVAGALERVREAGCRWWDSPRPHLQARGLERLREAGCRWWD